MAEQNLVSYKSNANILLKQIGKYPDAVYQAETRAGRSTGFYAREELVSYIKTGGGGTWGKAHPLTLGRRYSRFLRTKYPGEMLANFLRYRSKNRKKVIVDYGRIRGREGYFFSRETFPEEFDYGPTDIDASEEALLLFAKRFELGSNTPATPKLKRWMAWRGYPLKKATSMLRMPARPIFSSVYPVIKGKMGSVFDKKFAKKFSEEEKKI